MKIVTKSKIIQVIPYQTIRIFEWFGISSND